MRLLIDAEGLIKLHRAGVLARVVGTFSCVTSEAVYEEVVSRGKERLHQDAVDIQAILSGRVSIQPIERREEPELRLGAGELSLLSLLPDEQDAIVISDDRRFLSVLTARGLAFLTPSDLLVVMARRHVFSGIEVREALERLRPMIRPAAYWAARHDLEGGGD